MFVFAISLLGNELFTIQVGKVPDDPGELHDVSSLQGEAYDIEEITPNLYEHEEEDVTTKSKRAGFFH